MQAAPALAGRLSRRPVNRRLTPARSLGPVTGAASDSRLAPSLLAAAGARPATLRVAT